MFPAPHAKWFPAGLKLTTLKSSKYLLSIGNSSFPGFPSGVNELI